MKPNILIVEDDDNISELMRYNLEKSGYTVETCDDGEEALFCAGELNPDAILLDWMLPNLSGIEICRRLRRAQKTANVPIIMITARSEEADRIRGLEIGADDYLTKPFSPRELVARVQAVLRRVRPALTAQKISFEDIVVDTLSHRVTRGNHPIHLGPTEYRLLSHLMNNPRRVFSRDQLLDKVWGHDVYVEERTVDVHIRRLRKSLNQDDLPDYIRTIRSAGYALDTEA
ncbi:phosphate regulon transcriptional regulator PhoB [Temperatibacter marinus]|uniref:Phosphate regulon transcriptional regulatory protein PhoB n=1 Tax=Temperatibacter marinus TaxID=1456591 RepID=A0AA52EGA7_9PROT|nr:phosphate regulon transcriptional regulator PhoB [Temperatibacter marinus]WND02598.1 phosphate regulon transcriptional regulator PhoB [Temperatibacter marinus]